MQNVLLKLKLKPGSLPKLRSYLAELDARREECNESLDGEQALLESFFTDDEYLYVFKKLHDLALSKQFQKSSSFPIYDTVKRMMADCVESRQELLSVLDFDREDKNIISIASVQPPRLG